MQTTMEALLYTTLKNMIVQCKEMQTLLQTDINSFSKNDLAAVGESNKKKSAVIAQLKNLVSELNNIKMRENAGSFSEAVDKQLIHADAPTRNSVRTQIETLKIELTKCYQYLLTNNNVVFANIQHLKDIWDQLIACGSQMSQVYDHMGNTQK
jgi:hypothetical protein